MLILVFIASKIRLVIYRIHKSTIHSVVDCLNPLTKAGCYSCVPTRDMPKRKLFSTFCDAQKYYNNVSCIVMEREYAILLILIYF